MNPSTNLMPLRSLLRSSKDIPTVNNVEAENVNSPGKREAFFNALKRAVDRISSSVLSSSTATTRATTPVATTTKPPTIPTADGRPTAEALPTKQKSLRKSTRRPTPAVSQLKADGKYKDERSTSDVNAKKIKIPPTQLSDPSPLTDADLRTLFAGAPHFSLPRGRDEGELKPTVTFPFGDQDGEHLPDHRVFGHVAFALASTGNAEEERWVSEVPNMKGSIGAEPGTCGWDYFLMVPVGDAERDADSAGFEDALDEGGRERGGGMRNSRSAGVRSVELAYIAERLKELGQIWIQKKRERKAAMRRSEDDKDDSTGDEDEVGKEIPSSVEMYTHLFTYLLFPPTRVTTEDYHDPYSLKVQVMAIIKTLSSSMWLDFSNVAWRIKLGQVLWGSFTAEDDYEEWETAVKESEKVMLLLQILLSCELVMRLDSLFEEAEFPPSSPTSEGSGNILETKDQMLGRFREAGGRKVQWDIVLARRWLQNVKVVESEIKGGKAGSSKEPEKSFLSPPSWFLAARPQQEPAPEPETPDSTKITDAMLVPRHARRQVEGLVHFARRMQWPNIDLLASQFRSRLYNNSNTPSSSVCNTPMLTPMNFANSIRDSYFPAHTSSPRPGRSREISNDVSMPKFERRKSVLAMPTSDSSGGWLSRSYLTGLILPGEGLSHLLISTLLENDMHAVDTLGFNANLYGGFQYGDNTWWSRYCIVGRVLAGFAGAAEESGWVGPVIPSGVENENFTLGRIPDGWVDVAALPPDSEKQPRALTPEMVASNSDVRGRGWRKSRVVCKNELEIVHEAALEDLRVEVKGMYFSPAEPELSPEAEFPVYDVALHFRYHGRVMIYNLRYDVSYVAAWPCGGSRNMHPLHTSYLHHRVTLDELVELGEVDEEMVTVVDIHTPEQRVLTYSWCSQRGWNALVARRGRTCLGCAIRETWAVGLKIVIRV